YGLSEGFPTEKGLKIDAQTALDYIKDHPVIGKTKLVAYGQSIGGAVSIDIVAKNESKFSGLIVENTFLSLPKVIPHSPRVPLPSKMEFRANDPKDKKATSLVPIRSKR
ncbi:bem46 protein, variant, partial [Entomortierella beljakovae]